MTTYLGINLSYLYPYICIAYDVVISYFKYKKRCDLFSYLNQCQILPVSLSVVNPV
jgi:hypothetical protein